MHAQTRPQLDQLHDLLQVRLGTGDDRPGTLLDPRQIDPGRWVCRPTWLPDPAENGQPTICRDHLYGIRIGAGELRMVRCVLAYTAAGRATMFAQDPELAAWWELHKNDVPAPAQ